MDLSAFPTCGPGCPSIFNPREVIKGSLLPLQIPSALSKCSHERIDTVFETPILSCFSCPFRTQGPTSSMSHPEPCAGLRSYHVDYVISPTRPIKENDHEIVPLSVIRCPSYLPLLLPLCECLIPYFMLFPAMRIYLRTFVTCFDTMELSLRGVIQVSDFFSPIFRCPFYA